MMGVMSGVNSENWLSIINEGTLGRENTLNETLPSEKTIQYQPSNPSFYEQKKPSLKLFMKSLSVDRIKVTSVGLN